MSNQKKQYEAELRKIQKRLRFLKTRMGTSVFVPLVEAETSVRSAIRTLQQGAAGEPSIWPRPSCPASLRD